MSDYSEYTWIVTQGAIVGDSSGMVGQVGPAGAKKRARFDTVIQKGAHFRLLDAAGNLRYSGYIVGHYTGFEPLDEYGHKKGCNSIEFDRNGVWTALER